MLCAIIGGGVYIFQSYLGHLAFPDFGLFADFLNSFFTAAYVPVVWLTALFISLSTVASMISFGAAARTASSTR